MGYLEKLQSVEVGDYVFIKGRDSVSSKVEILSIDEDEATLDCDGNDNVPWRFSISTSNAINPPTAYWISCDEGNNP